MQPWSGIGSVWRLVLPWVTVDGSTSVRKSGFGCRKNGTEYRGCRACSPGGLTTRWVVEGYTWLVRRCSMSPMLTTMVSSSEVNGTHSPCCDFTSRPAALAPTSKVIRLMSSCRSEEHTSELQSLMRISYAVFCLKKQKNIT